MEFSRKIILPDTFYGDEVPPLEAFTDEVSEFHGMPTSRGYYSGKVTVIQTLDEADKLEDGDVLVVPYSDVAWTPLFGRAGAVIAQSGGVLSHSSIVAREMGIPCVVSVANACQLQDGTVVVVDGHRGEIMIKEAAQ
jgi:pyruvate,water dikinase